jgi:predicted nucleotide-binding protein (sugar kinase/HSP70/actin superfamily)
VPKRELIVTLVTLVETGRLKIANQLPNSADLIDELLGFKVRINPRTRQETYQAGRGTVHDDIVVAVALACFLART